MSNTNTNNRRGLLPRTNKGRAIAVLGGGIMSILILVGGTGAQDLGATTQPSAGHARATTGPNNTMINDGLSKDGAIRITVNKTTVVTTTRPYKQVSIGQPEIAD